MKKKNFIAKDLFSKKYKPRVIKPKKGKGSFFFRKGKVGSWKQELNKKLVKKIEQKFNKEMLELGYI